LAQEQAPIVINTYKKDIMNTDIKQAMHVEAAKSFSTAEANENERRWNDDKIDRKNQDSTNNYDKTRMKLNFEIGSDGKVHPLGYNEKPLEVRLQERLSELGWKPFKPDSKIQPNCCARFIFGGNHDRTIEMAFGNQTVNLEKDADNSHLHRCEEIEHWAKNVYDWCAKRYGQENIVGFQVHLDESSPHIHALIVPVGVRPKSGRECVMWSAKFGKNRFEYGQILKDMHTSLYEEVGCKYGLDRGDSIDGRNVQHLHKRDYIRKLTKETKQAEKAVKGLQSMMRHLESKIFSYNQQLEKAEQELASGKITLDKYEAQKTDIQKLLAEYQTKLDDKAGKLHAKELELEQLTKDAAKARSVVQPFRNHNVDFTPPQITEKVPLFRTDKWVESQNQHIAKQFTTIVRKIESLYRNDAARQVEAAQRNVLADYGELFQLRNDVKSLTENNDNLKSTLETILDQLANPALRSKIFAITDALICGQPVSISSGGGGSTSDLPWDGRRPDEEEEAYRRRCLMFAMGTVKKHHEKKSYRKR
jgi:ATPase involved in DNA repair